MNKFSLLSFLRLLCLNLAMFTCTSQAATTESAVKVGFIYNFTKFIQWPASTSMYATFNLCVVGDNRLEDALQALEGKMVGIKPIKLHLNLSVEKLNVCQMLFVAEDDTGAISVLLKKADSMPIVAVSDSPDFISRGGMIGLVRDGTRLGFEVNLAPARRAGVQVSSQLLKLAKRVKGSK